MNQATSQLDRFCSYESRTLNQIKKNDIIIKPVYYDNGQISSLHFYIITRINKKSISTKSCNRTGCVEADADITSFNIDPDFAKWTGGKDQTWDILIGMQ